jgi:hypothetical protein
MANVIKLKYGSGIPGDGQLQTGELGLDLTNKVIYTADALNNIIELSRNMGEGGTIEWDQIVNVPIEIENIINGEIPEYGSLDALIAQVKANAGDIAALQAWETTAKAEIIKLQSDVAQNTADISTNAGDIDALETSQGAQDILISANADKIQEIDGRVTSNKGEIDDIWAAMDKDLTGLVLAGSYSAASGLITSVKSTAVDEEGKVLFAENQPLNAYLGNPYAGFYFIVDEAGELKNTGSPARADGDMAYIGDWLVSDGPHWLHFNFSQESTVWGTISGNIELQEDLQDQFATKLGINDDIVGGTYTA